MRTGKNVNCLVHVVALIIVAMIVILAGVVRLDFQAGSHKITPTAMDTTAGGHYRVYYKTSDYTRESEESHYYIEKDNTEVQNQMMDAIKEGKTIMVYYDSYVGFKGFFAPQTAPITRIEILEDK